MIPTDPLFHKPQSIIAAKNILYATIFLGVIILVICEMSSGYGKYSNIQWWITSIIIFGIILILTKQIGLGKKWARMAFLILFLLGAFFFPYSLIQLFRENFLIEILFIFQAVLQILAIIFLFTQKSTDWFNRVRSTDPQ